MKKIYTIIAVMLMSIGCVMAQTSGLSFPVRVHNFGTIQEDGGVVSHTFGYTNTSGQPLVIIEVQTSCGCTTPHYDRQQINPGAAGSLTINFDPLNRPGAINKTVRVLTNLGATDLIIDGTVSPRQLSLEESFPFNLMHGIRMDRFAISGLQTPFGGTSVTKMYVANSSHTTPVLFSIDPNSLTPEISAVASSNVIGPRDVAEITITTRGLSYGKFSHNLKFIVNGLTAPENLLVEGITVDDFGTQSRSSLLQAPRIALSKNYMNLGQVAKITQSEFSIVVRNEGLTPLEIRSISTSKNLRATPASTTIPAGKSTFLKVTHTPTSEGYDQGSITLVVNDPKSPIVEIRTIAEVI